ncbi:MAG: hypothetical protein AAF611_09360 [Bacteroidota bacterium]
MSQFDQHTAMISLEEALVPSAGLVDSRTEIDNLRLLVDFASLFNFYDRTNTINGNWSPFLLKDPVFLVASIAKTSFQKAYSLFINTCLQLKKILKKKDSDQQQNVENNSSYLETFISNGFNQLFDQLSTVFQTIERWSHYMYESTSMYNLKTYIINSIKDTYGLILWSLLDLRQDLYSYGQKKDTTIAIPEIQPVDTYVYENYDKKVWDVHKNELPYWTVLGLPTYPCDGSSDTNSDEQCFDISSLSQDELYDSLYATGKKVFSFYSKCISYADTEMKTLEETPGNFPDTILLRTFTSLLKIYQKQFNGLSKKHLHFYYQDILKQAAKSVTPDSVYASSALSKKTAAYQLEKNVIFSAGVDSDKQPILFETTDKTWLNPAKIVNAYTLSGSPVDKSTNSDTYLSELFLTQLQPVDKVTKDDSGAIQTWKTFGTQLPQNTPSNTMALAFGSPMFYLTEAATRTITLNFSLSRNTYSTIFKKKENVTFYFSTAKAWFEIPSDQITIDFSTTSFELPMTIDCGITMTINLQKSDPAITAFTKNPDGYTCEWPLFKILFQEFAALATPPLISTMTIEVEVDGLQNFQLYNDFGQVNPKKPFQLLGGTPKVNQHFMVGNAEVFSKPTNDINFTLTWNPFDTNFDFGDYYKEYNNYLSGAYSGKTLYVNELDSLIKKLTKLQDSFYKDISQSEDKMFKRILRRTKVSQATRLIQDNLDDLDKSLKQQTKKLNKQSDKAGNLVTTINTENSTMISDIKTALTNLSSAITKANKVDETTVNTTKTEITNRIDTTKSTVSKDIEDAKNTALSTNIQEKKSLFKRVSGIFSSKDNTGLNSDTSATPAFQFSNTSFSVDFQRLQNGVWTDMNDGAEENLYFTDTTEDTTSIPASRDFDFSDINLTAEEVDPSLQETALQLSDTTSSGFLRMKLSEPMYGFGSDLYTKVVQAIALFNAEIIAEKIKYTKDSQTLVSPANIPFVPMVSSFEGNYTASVTYDFSKNEQSYPLQCFYNTPFTNYKVYDTTLDEKIITENTTIGSSPERDSNGNIIPLTGLPLLPTIAPKGQLLLELQDLIMPASVSFYFELARAYTEKVLTTKEVSYSYLSSDGWKPLTEISDGTNSFTCSGIITIYIPADITTVHDTISGTNYWIAIGTTDNPDSFPQTSYLNTNGFTLQRIVSKTDYSKVKPQILADAITGPQTAIPEIGATVQPFASFGGKAAETKAQMNSRVSNRLKTKDRLVTAEDFFNTIRLEFPEVYYSKTIYKTATKKSFTYLVKRVADASETHAFEPLLSECKELEIQQYIDERVSPFVNVSVENFELKYVKITADIQVQSDADVTSTAKEVNDGINIFLSPWITSAQSQITIDDGLNTAQIAAFINTYNSILEVNSISFQVGTKDFTTGIITYEDSTQEVAAAEGIVLVPSLNNTTKNSLITYHQ